eukprot:SAG11_NODE_5824_length_1455_cov_3.115044_1_plen_260_part_00
MEDGDDVGSLSHLSSIKLVKSKKGCITTTLHYGAVQGCGRGGRRPTNVLATRSRGGDRAAGRHSGNADGRSGANESVLQHARCAQPEIHQALMAAMVPYEGAMQQLLEQRWPSCAAEALVKVRPERRGDRPVSPLKCEQASGARRGRSGDRPPDRVARPLLPRPHRWRLRAAAGAAGRRPHYINKGRQYTTRSTRRPPMDAIEGNLTRPADLHWIMAAGCAAGHPDGRLSSSFASCTSLLLLDSQCGGHITSKSINLLT